MHSGGGGLDLYVSLPAERVGERKREEREQSQCTAIPTTDIGLFPSSSHARMGLSSHPIPSRLALGALQVMGPHPFTRPELHARYT